MRADATPIIAGRIDALRSRGAALALLAGLGAFALAGALAPAGAGPALIASWAFRLLAAALTVSLTVAVIRWLPGLNRLRSWGRFLLHAGILTVLVGAVFNAWLSRRGRIEVIEGQTVPLPGGRASVRLDRFHAFFKPGRWHKGAAAALTIFEDGSARPALVHINLPARSDGRSLLLDRHGFAPRIRLDGPGGRLLDGYVSLETEMGKDVFYRRTLRVPGSGLRMALDFTPSPNGPLVRDPRLAVALMENGKVLRRQVLPAGATMTAGAYRLSFRGVRYWAALHVCRDPGLPLVYAGFTVTMVGALICFWRSAWA